MRNAESPSVAALGPALHTPHSALRATPWLLGMLLVAAVILAYKPAWKAGFIWDDDAYVTSNPLLTAPDGLAAIWFSRDQPSQYFPLVYTSFRLEHALWGLNAAGYHWVNILLHAANALLVWRLLRRLSVPGAWLAAALFALHPVQVETVAWITERKNLLMLLFSLLALLAWVEFVQDRPKPHWRFYCLALACYQLALFSKTTACTLPAALLLVLWLKHGHIDWRRLAQVAPFVVLGVLMGLVTMWWERHNIGVQQKVQALSLLERILVASHAAWFYLGKLVWPAGLTFSYPRWVLNPTSPLAYVWLAAGVGMAAVIWYVRRFTGRSVEVAALFFVATLSPLLGFIMLTTFRWSFVADHYQYFACLGPFALAAAGMVTAFRKWSEAGILLRPVVSGALLAVLGGLTFHQAKAYQDQGTVWRDTLAKNPASWMAHVNLGQILLEKGEFEEAKSHLQAALKLQPDNPTAEVNLGSVFLQEGQTDEALAQWRKVLEHDPGNADAHNRIAEYLFQQGHADVAIAQWQATLQNAPGDPSANVNLGAAYLLKGQVDKAATQFETALRYSPYNGAALAGLGTTLAQKGQTDKAISMFRKALQIQPRNRMARYNLGNLLLQLGRADEAIPELQALLAAQPDDIEIRNDLIRAAWMLATSPDASARDGAKALALARQLDQLAGGNDPAVLAALAAAYAETGRFTDALATARQALQLPSVQANAALTRSFQTQIELFKTDRPMRDPGAQRGAAPPSGIKP